VSYICMNSRREGSEQVSANGRGSATRVAANWLSLAATPTFAIMALLTAFAGGQQDMLCAAMHSSPFAGMVPMYLLMSTFHVAPWLELIFRRKSGAARPGKYLPYVR
jgi:hypothetical protein